MMNSLVVILFTLQYLERELRMEGLPFPYSFEVSTKLMALNFLFLILFFCGGGEGRR